MEKVIVLNSGGFDSTVLMNYVAKELDKEIISLSFSYGQKSAEQERYYSRLNAIALGAEIIEIELPKFSWSNSSILEEEEGSVYLEMRNLIFLSYAVSLAESRGVKEIYVAFIDPEMDRYPDASPEFVESMNALTESLGISIEAPFMDLNKEEIAHLSLMLQAGDDYFSCNTPVDGEKCGVCADCVADKYIREMVLDCSMPLKAWIRGDSKFFDLYHNCSIAEIRILNTDECQFKCRHCFYGFEKMKGEQLTVEEFKNVIDQCAELKVKNVHFSGREPLCDENIFELMDYVRDTYPEMTCDLVTNGVYISKYLQRLVESKANRIYLSVDSVEDTIIRPSNGNLIKNIKLILDSPIPLEVFIDIHQGNKSTIKTIVENLYALGVRKFYLRAVLPLGRCPKELIVSAEDLEEVFDSLLEIEEEDFQLDFYVNMRFMDEVLGGDSALSEAVSTAIDGEIQAYTSTISVIYELYCSRYQQQITLTPDGYILGCATEVSSPAYDILSAGNVREAKLKDLIILGKTRQEKLIENRFIKTDSKKSGCFHSKP